MMCAHTGQHLDAKMNDEEKAAARAVMLAALKARMQGKHISIWLDPWTQVLKKYDRALTIEELGELMMKFQLRKDMALGKKAHATQRVNIMAEYVRSHPVGGNAGQGIGATANLTRKGTMGGAMVDTDKAKQGLRRVSDSGNVQGGDADADKRKLRRVDAAIDVQGGHYMEQTSFNSEGTTGVMNVQVVQG